MQITIADILKEEEVSNNFSERIIPFDPHYSLQITYNINYKYGR